MARFTSMLRLVLAGSAIALIGLTTTGCGGDSEGDASGEPSSSSSAESRQADGATESGGQRTFHDGSTIHEGRRVFGAPGPHRGGGAMPQPAEMPLKHAKAMATLAVARDAAWLKRHEAQFEAAYASKPRVVFLGDSITDLWSTDGAEIWKERFEPLGAFNMGIAGDRTEHLLWRINWSPLDTVRPKVCVVLIGTNNIRGGGLRMAPEAAAAGIESVAGAAATKAPGSHVLVVSVLPRQPEYEWIDEAIARANAQVKAFCGRYPQFTYVDATGPFLKRNGQINEEMYGDDLLHLSPKGYAALGEVLEPEIRKALKRN